MGSNMQMKAKKWERSGYRNGSLCSLFALLVVLLSSVGCKSAVSVESLRAQLKDTDYRVRIKAAQEIARIGRSADSAYPDLLAAMKEETTANYQHLPFYTDAMVKIGQNPATTILQAVRSKDRLLAQCVASGLKDIDQEAAKKVVPELAMLLQDPDNDICSGAAETLQILGARATPAIQDLVQVLRNDRGICRDSAIMALGSMKREASAAIPELIAALNDREFNIRFQAVVALEDIGPEARAAIPAIREMVKTNTSAPLPGRGEGAIKRIGEFPPPPLMELLPKLKSQEFKIRGEAFDGLRHYERSRALENIPAVLAALKTDLIDDRVAATEALGVLGWADAGQSVPPLVEALGDKDERIQLAALSALGAIGSMAESAVPAIAKAMQSGSANIKTYAGFALGQIGRFSVPHLMELLKDGNADVRIEAAYTLGNISFPQAIEAIPALRSSLQDTDQKVRAQVAVSLALIDPGAIDALPILVKALKSNDQRMKGELPMALYNIGPKAVPALIELAKDDKQLTRSFSVMALSNMGTPEAKDAVEKLKKDTNK